MSKPATRNAWNKPLAAPPGLVPATKKPVDIIMRERFLHLMLSLVGQTISITLKSGAVIEGIMHTFTPFESLSAEHLNKYVIKSAKVIKGDVDIKGGTLIVGADKVSNVHIKSLRLEQSRQGGDSFQTDTDISAGGGNVKDDLVVAGNAWTTEKPSSNGRAGMFGTKNNDLSGGIGDWDQFHANETQFGVKASFDENLYTTSLDKTTVDKNKLFEAEKMAREIEGKKSSNMHVAEERGQAIEGDYDEEDLYSGVLVTGDKKDTKDTKERTKLVLKPRTAEEQNKKGDEEATSPAPAKNLATPAAPAASAPTKTMNWAAMVAKSDKKGAAPQETKEQITTKETTAEEKPVEKKEPKVETEPVPTPQNEEEPAEKAVEPKIESKEPETEEKPEKPKTKLNANAKSFSFNPSAKSFTPTFSAPAPAPDLQPAHVDQHVVMMQQQQYMQYHPAGAPGPMMYPGGYPPQMQYPQGGPYGMMQRAPQGQLVGPNGGEDGAMSNVDSAEKPPSPVEGGEASNEHSASTTPTLHEGEKGDEGSSEQSAQAAAQQPKQQGMPAMAYPGGPSGYYNGGNMPAMVGRGPGQQQHYHPQMVAPQGLPRGYVFQGMQSPPMHQGNMPQYNMGVPHFIPGQPYMQGGYPAGRPMEGDDMGYRSGGRGGRAGGRGRGNGRGGGRGRGPGGGRGGKYNANFNGQNQTRNQDGAPDTSDGTSQQHGSNHSE